MASAFQQKSVQRKVVYFGLILALLTTTLILRGRWSMRVTPSLTVGGLETQATNLALREQDLGEVELTSSAVRLLLTGSRGLVVCSLWMAAIDKQKKHQWNEVDLLVTSITKIQPHFITPWLFQSWNLAYNVSVESDRVKDKYFYISRGMQLLAEGEQRIKDHPDLRQMMGTYYQSKFGLSDETNTLRSLLQMSCIDPIERNPARFRRSGSDREVNLEEFEQFCRAHPRLVRRLRETPGKRPDEVLRKTPEEVVDFLAENQKIPSRFKDLSETDLSTKTVSPPREPLDRFPILPPVHPQPPYEDAPDNQADLGDDFENYVAARSWFGYAQDPLLKGRRPRFMATLLFQGQPPRAQANQAERSEKEGWFDEGWDLSEWFPGRSAPVVVGEKLAPAGELWERAYQMYLWHGKEHGLHKSTDELKKMDTRELQAYESNRGLTNFPHFINTTAVERTKEAVVVRKFFHRAEQARQSGNRSRAIELYEDPAAFGPPTTWAKAKATGWKRILLNNPDYREDGEIQEEMYTWQVRYLNLLQDRWDQHFKRLLVLQNYLGQSVTLPASGGVWLPPAQLARFVSAPIQGPLDDVTESGEPFIREETKERVRSRNPFR